MKSGKVIILLLGVLAFGIGFASQNGWQRNYVLLVALDAIITAFYIWLCWRNRRFVRQLASMPVGEQQAIIEKMPSVVKGVLNRELKK